MKTVSTKLDKKTFEKFQEICENDGQCISERLRESIKMEIRIHDEDVGIEDQQMESTSESPKPVANVIRISFDGKNWYNAN